MALTGKYKAHWEANRERMLCCVICHRLLKQTLRPTSEEMDYCGATCAPASLPSCAMGSALKPPANLYIDAAGTAWTSNACPCGSGTEIGSGDSSVSSGVSVSNTANGEQRLQQSIHCLLQDCFDYSLDVRRGRGGRGGYRSQRLSHGGFNDSFDIRSGGGWGRCLGGS